MPDGGHTIIESQTKTCPGMRESTVSGPHQTNGVGKMTTVSLQELCQEGTDLEITITQYGIWVGSKLYDTFFIKGELENQQRGRVHIILDLFAATHRS